MVLRLLILFSLSSYIYASSTSYQDLIKINAQLNQTDPKNELITKGELLINELEDNENEELEDQIEQQLEIFEKHKETYQNSIYNNSYFIQISYLTWNTPLSIERETKSDVKLLSEEKGPCVGFGYEISNARNGFQTSLCYALINATISEDEDSGISFHQSDVNVSAFVLQNNYIYKIERDLRFKLGVPIIHRLGEYGDVSEGEVVDQKNISLGYSFGSSWQLDQYLIDFNFGAIESFNSSFWLFSIHYTL